MTVGAGHGALQFGQHLQDIYRRSKGTQGATLTVAAWGLHSERAMVDATVVGVQGALKGKRFALSGRPITFGRDESNDVVIPSEAASRIHAEVRYEDDAACWRTAAVAMEPGSMAPG